jgi:hypothetical protein
MNARLPNLSFADKTRLLRHDLSSFIGVSFGVLTPGTEYQHSWHIDLIASKLAAWSLCCHRAASSHIARAFVCPPGSWVMIRPAVLSAPAILRNWPTFWHGVAVP